MHLGVVVARVLVTLASFSAAQNTAVVPAAACREWHECQRLALEAHARGEYELFHDLAWRTVQTGPSRNPELMYMLARAQSLSGRPHDALVMLERLAEMKFATAAATDDDFRPVRQLRQWSELEAALGATAMPSTAAASAAPVAPAPSMPAAASTPIAPPTAAPPMATPAATPLANASPSPAAGTPARRQAEEALRIPGSMPGPAGLAYDRVSSRFVAADSSLRKLIVIDERSRHVVDLVTANSAGFYDITGLEIDPLRGDLWVVSAEPVSAGAEQPAASALHKLQLVSGRPLQTILVPPELHPCRLVDVAVTTEGRILVLDGAGGRLLRFRPGAQTFAPTALLHLEAPTSLAPAGERIVYVAHATGIARVDTVTGAVDAVTAPRDVALAGFERIRWARDSLVGVQRLPDGTQRAVRVKIADGRAAALEVIDNALSPSDRPVTAVSGDEFYFLVHQAGGESGEVVIRRSKLR